MAFQAALLSITLFLCPIIAGGFGELTNAIVQIPIFLALAAWLLKDKHALTKLRNTNLVYIISSFLLLLIISAFFTNSIYLSIKQVVYWIVCVSAYFIAAQLSDEKRFFRSVVLSISFAAFIVSLYGIRYYALVSGGGAAFWSSLSGSGDHMRLFGTFVNPGFFAGFLVLSIPISFAIFLSSRRLLSIILSSMSLACQIIAILLTGTKFGVLAALAACFLLIVFGFAARVFRRTELFRILIILILLIPLAFTFAKPVTSRVEKSKIGGTDTHSASFRVYAWKTSVDILKANPIIGTGPGTYEIVYPRYAIAGITKHAHQGFLQIADESGVIALLLFLISLGGIAVIGFKKIWIIRKAHPAAKEFKEFSSITFEDFLPDCKLTIVYISFICAAAGSIIRNMVDSDWFVAGIAITFFVILGMVAGTNNKPIKELKNTILISKLKAAFCFILIVVSISLGGGDYYLSKAADSSYKTDLLQRAVNISPWNPKVLIALGRVYGGDSWYFNQAEIFSRSDNSVYQSRAYAYLQDGNYDESAKYFLIALKYHPKSTSTMLVLSNIYKEQGNTVKEEVYLNKILELENTPYEQVKGVPEIVDTSYAYAHFYFGEKYLNEKEYAKAIAEFEASAKRLEKWRSYESFLEVERASGRLSADKEKSILQLLQDSYNGLASAYQAIGENSKAADAEEKASKVDFK